VLVLQIGDGFVLLRLFKLLGGLLSHRLDFQFNLMIGRGMLLLDLNLQMLRAILLHWLHFQVNQVPLGRVLLVLLLDLEFQVLRTILLHRPHFQFNLVIWRGVLLLDLHLQMLGTIPLHWLHFKVNQRPLGRVLLVLLLNLEFQMLRWLLLLLHLMYSKSAI